MEASSGAARIASDGTPEVPGGSDLVLFHAGVTDRRSWSPLIARLRENHRCVAFDARGFGDSTCSRQNGWSGRDGAVAHLPHLEGDPGCLDAITAFVGATA